MSELVVGHGRSNVRGPLPIKGKANPDAAYQEMYARLRAEGAAAERTRLLSLFRALEHPGEGPCPVCGAIFETHVSGCPYEEVLAIFDGGKG